MNMKQYLGTNYLRVEDVKASETKRMIFLSAGKERTVETRDNRSFKVVDFDVEMDAKQYIFTPNSKVIADLIDLFGEDSKDWLSKIVELTIVEFEGKEYVNVVRLEQQI